MEGLSEAALIAVKSLLVLTLFATSLAGQTLADRADTALANWSDPNGPGTAVVLIKDGHILYRRDFGLADIDAHRPVSAGTQFLLGSVTKQFTATSIMILKERGKLQFEDTLAKFCAGPHQ